MTYNIDNRFTRAEELDNLFAKASKLDKSKFGYMAESEWKEKITRDGAKKFKRRALGLCGRQTVKSLDEMAKLLTLTGIASSAEEGKKLVPDLAGCNMRYSQGSRVTISEVKDKDNQTAYRIFTYVG